jgi:biopolymer transport protein ExbB
MMTWLTQLGGYISQGGFVMWPLVFLALLLWFGIGYRLFFIRRGTRLPVRDLVAQARVGLPEVSRGSLDEAVRRGLRVDVATAHGMQAVLEDELFPIEEDLGRYRTLVRTIIIVAPLLGLLGTVNGMIEMFQSLGDQNFYSQSGGVAQGISQALFTTQFGLVIAIPGMLVGSLIDLRERRIRDDLAQLKELLIAGVRL